ncbi:MAG TPA: hypothetical protein VN282_02305 [Pyrinomonadaceae bacterium]|nr:hypothetical protein [Pyrinomonadaceae bacterium]
MPYLVIEVPPPTNDCFVALPFTEHFDDLFEAIEEAAKSAGLDEAIRLDQKEEGVTITGEIERRIRSTRIVVAVCTPESYDGPPNPNVMYELGLAHALGKPTVILAASMGCVPVDVRDQFVFVYGGVPRERLVKEVQKRIEKRLASTTGSLVSAGFRHIAVAPRRHQMLLNPDFWRHFSDVFRRVRVLRGEMQRMIPDLAELLKAAQGMLASDSYEVRIDFDEKWRKFDNSYQTVTHATFKEWVEGEGIGLALDSLSGPTRGSTVSQIDDVRIFYNSTKDALREYMPAHSSLIELLAGERLIELNDHGRLTKIYGQITALRQATDKIFHQTDAIIYNLVEASIRIGES